MNIRYGRWFRMPRKIVKHILSLLYPIIIFLFPLPKVLSIEETIEILIKKKYSIIRFGDSEFLYIIDKLNKICKEDFMLNLDEACFLNEESAFGIQNFVSRNQDSICFEEPQFREDLNYQLGGFYEYVQQRISMLMLSYDTGIGFLAWHSYFRFKLVGSPFWICKVGTVCLLKLKGKLVSYFHQFNLSLSILIASNLPSPTLLLF